MLDFVNCCVFRSVEGLKNNNLVVQNPTSGFNICNTKFGFKAKQAAPEETKKEEVKKPAPKKEKKLVEKKPEPVKEEPVKEEPKKPELTEKEKQLIKVKSLYESNTISKEEYETLKKEIERKYK